MGFFTTRERSELDKETDMEGEMREFVRRDVVALRRNPEARIPEARKPDARKLEAVKPETRKPEPEGQSVATSLGALLQRVVGTSEQQIDSLIAELQSLRDKLEADGARVQREIVEYANLSQSAMRSTKIISENLAHWKQVSDAPSLAPDLKASGAEFSEDY